MENQLSSGKEWLEQLLAHMGMAAAVETDGFEVTADSNSNWLNISSQNLTEAQKQQLIGNKGENIDAIQYLANTVLNLGVDQEAKNSFTVEIDGYRVKRNQELATWTQEAIARVQSTGEEVEIPGLSSAERKQIHFLMEDVPGLKSESRGQEPNRKLIVLPE
ncbi:MAG: R3H domain-containing nucleic acid-binding protein [Cyanobacteria bacterium J06623_7]